MLSTLKLATPDSKQKIEYDDGIKLYVSHSPSIRYRADIVRRSKASEKNTIQTPWTLHSKLTGPQSFSPVSSLTLNDKLDTYFADHSFMPLFMQENYLKAKFSRSSSLGGVDKDLKDLELISLAADSMSDGDLVDRMIHGYARSSLSARI